MQEVFSYVACICLYWLGLRAQPFTAHSLSVCGRLAGCWMHLPGALVDWWQWYRRTAAAAGCQARSTVGGGAVVRRAALRGARLPVTRGTRIVDTSRLPSAHAPPRVDAVVNHAVWFIVLSALRTTIVPLKMFPRPWNFIMSPHDTTTAILRISFVKRSER